jgi:hypothetical protein
MSPGLDRHARACGSRRRNGSTVLPAGSPRSAIQPKAKPMELVLDVSAGTTLGLGILALRALLH